MYKDTQPLKPTTTILVKLGSLAVHANEMLSSKGHHFDASAIEGLLADPELKAWLKAMNDMALLPVKR